MGKTQDLPDRGLSLDSWENMMKYTPGGIHKCFADAALTIISVSENFLELFGYTETEIKVRFNNCFIPMIYDEDRADVMKELSLQLLCGDTIEVEYRIQRKDGRIIWISDKARLVTEEGQPPVFYCILSDITKRREEKEELRLSLERHKVIMDQATDIIFEWDIRKDTLIFSPNWYKKFGYAPIRDGITERIPESKNIHPDDMQYFKKIMEDTALGGPYSETEIRIRNVLGDYAVCRIRATTQYDSCGCVMKAIGVITDISEEKRQRQVLMEQAQRDSLTGLLHKDAAKREVDSYIIEAEAPRGIMLIIDLDEFKLVNDHFGHLCGDALLADAAGILHRIFCTGDILSRVGGDEFLVFLPGITKSKAMQKVHSLKEAFADITVSGMKGIMSCSVGVSLYPEHADNFNGLYKCADLALYHVKNKKKGETAIYSPRMKENRLCEKIARTAVSTVIDSDIDAVNELLSQYSFRMLYDAMDTVTAVQALLEIIGCAYDVSRVSIFEDSDDEMTSSNTFEWCNTGVKPQINNMQNLDYAEELKHYRSNFDEDGVFYCGDISRLEPALYKLLKSQNTCSLLQCAILDSGRFRGYVGFDECRENRFWTKGQIESLTLVSKVLSTFLLKYRLEQKFKRLETEMRTETGTDGR